MRTTNPAIRMGRALLHHGIVHGLGGHGLELFLPGRTNGASVARTANAASRGRAECQDGSGPAAANQREAFITNMPLFQK
jgi:hypothetical protein